LIYVWVVLFLFSFVLPASIFECSGQAGSATVDVSPPSITVSVGQDFSVDINVSSVSDLYGWEFKLGWNSSLLSLVSVNEGPFLRSGGNTFFTYYLNTTDEHLVVDCTLEGQIPGVSGNGTLATVMFNTTNAGQCPLNLYDVTLINSSEQTIPSQAVSGYGYFTSPQLHDVAVTQVTASPTALLPGGIVNIYVIVQDEGTFAEVFTVTVTVNSLVIGLQSAALNVGSSANLTFAWNTSSFGKGEYSVSASVSLTPGEVNAGNNVGTANTPVTILVPGHDVAIASLTPLKTVVGKGYNMSIGVTVKNYGVFSETFKVAAYTNTTLMGNQTVSLASGEKAELLFVESTGSMTKGRYNVSATAGPVPGETDLSDNTAVGGWVVVAIPGDVNADGTVNILDALILSNAYGSVPGGSNWNPNADINGDDVINILDAIIMANYFGQTSVY
jgi:hypothetical protein